MLKSNLDSRQISRFLREIEINHLNLYTNDSNINANLAAKIFLKLKENAMNAKMWRLSLDNKKLIFKLNKALALNPILFPLKRGISKSSDYYLFSAEDALEMLGKVFGADFTRFITGVGGDVNCRCKISSLRNFTSSSYPYNIILKVDHLYDLICPFIVFSEEGDK